MPEFQDTEAGKWRRTEERLHGHDEVLGRHETRIALTESQLKDMTPKLEMHEMVHHLERQIGELATAVRAEGAQTQVQMRSMSESITSLATNVGNTMQRLGEINEENMKREGRERDAEARRTQEKHEAQVAALKAQMESDAKRRQDEAAGREARSWRKQIVEWGAIVTGATVILGGLWWLFLFAMSHVPK